MLVLRASALPRAYADQPAGRGGGPGTGALPDGGRGVGIGPVARGPGRGAAGFGVAVGFGLALGFGAGAALAGALGFAGVGGLGVLAGWAGAGRAAGSAAAGRAGDGAGSGWPAQERGVRDRRCVGGGGCAGVRRGGGLDGHRFGGRGLRDSGRRVRVDNGLDNGLDNELDGGLDNELDIELGGVRDQCRLAHVDGLERRGGGFAAASILPGLAGTAALLGLGVGLLLRRREHHDHVAAVLLGRALDDTRAR